MFCVRTTSIWREKPEYPCHYPVQGAISILSSKRQKWKNVTGWGVELRVGCSATQHKTRQRKVTLGDGSDQQTRSKGGRDRAKSGSHFQFSDEAVRFHCLDFTPFTLAENLLIASILLSKSTLYFPSFGSKIWMIVSSDHWRYMQVWWNRGVRISALLALVLEGVDG